MDKNVLDKRTGKRGRPRKPDSEKGSRGFYVRLTEDIADLVEADADKEYRSKTAQISYIVEQYYKDGRRA